MSLVTANDYYAGTFFRSYLELSLEEEESEELEREDKAYGKLKLLVRKGDLEGLIASEEFKSYDINYRFGGDLKTLLHSAYFFNQPKIVAFLLQNGAEERIPDNAGLVPIECAKDHYDDSLPRVMNKVVKRYFEAFAYHSSSSDLLFEVIQKFIHEKQWKYCDRSSARKDTPFRDGRSLSLFGLPDLVYYVNCSDLSHLFVKAAGKIGFKADAVWYRGGFVSILPSEKEERGVIGDLAVFDGNLYFLDEDGRIRFGQHCVVYSSGWHYDLTLNCKYQQEQAILQ